MARRKELLANILFSSNLIGLFKRLPLKNKLIVLNYHRVRPDDPDFEPEFDENVFTIGASQFAVQMKWLAQNTHVLSEEKLIKAIREKKRFSRPAVMVTFDDGYRDNYTLAYPALKQNHIPAIFFISTGIIDKREVGWWDMIAYLVKKSSLPEINFNQQRFDLKKSRQTAIDFFQQRMKLEKYERTRHLIEDLARILEVDFPAPDLQDRQLLTWEQIEEMTQDVVTIGAHTHSHRVLATLDPTAQREEMVLSKLVLEKKLGRKVSSIAYPVGGPAHFTMETALIAQNCGYVLGFTCDSGVNSWNIEDLLTIRRVSGLLEDIRTVSAFVMLPDLFLWDKAIDKHQKVLREHPDYADFSFRLGLIHMGQGKLEKAIAAFEDALKHNPGYVEARIKLGVSQGYLGCYSDAALNLGKVLAEHPNYADVQYLTGIMHAAQGQTEKAIDHFQKAIQINPAYKDAYLKLGILQLTAGQYQKGLQALGKASSLDPADTDLIRICEMGNKILDDGEDSKATLLDKVNLQLFGGADRIVPTVQEFSRHIEISPNLSDMLGIISAHADKDDALKVLVPLFEEYVQQYPNYSDLRNIFGTLHLKLENFDTAIENFRKAIDLNPKFLKAHLNYFEALRRLKRFDEALKAAQYPLSLDLPYPDLYTHYAEVLFHLGRIAQAEANAQKALSINPDYQPAALLLERVAQKKDQ